MIFCALVYVVAAVLTWRLLSWLEEPFLPPERIPAWLCACLAALWPLFWVTLIVADEWVLEKRVEWFERLGREDGP